MKQPANYIGKPIRSLQTMLRVLAENDSRLQSLVPDGIYGKDTMASVTAFQRRYGLPVTGVTDQATWDQIAIAYELALIEQDAAEALTIVMDPGQRFSADMHSPHIYLVQAIFLALAELFADFPAVEANGTLDLPTQDALRYFQRSSNLPVTGELDKRTWRSLARFYALEAGTGL